jgi:hypothetical protein
MSLNNIDLPPKTIADFYKTNLVDSSEESISMHVTEHKKQWNYLGENKKKVLIVVNYPAVAHIPDAQLDFLTNLLGACKLNLGDSAILNYQHYSATDFNSIISFFGPKTIFLFGINPDDFGLPILFPHFQVQAFNEATYLFTPALQDIEADKILKSKLWVCLKKIFNL